MTRPEENDPILVEVVRSGFVESVHRARVVVTGPDGATLGSLGAASAPMYPRSSSKPLQAVGLLRSGLDLDGALLALVAASHSGESFHVDGVRQILTGAGLDESALQTPPDWPLDDATREAALRGGLSPSPVFMNCSGKHAGMLATTVALGADVRTYRAPEHPTQLAVLAALEELTGEEATALAVDGCGAPLFALTLTGLARAFGRLGAATDGPERRVADAIRAHPEHASGTTRDEAALHHAVPGLVGKAGAEAVYAVGLPDGRGVALKISDGGTRARTALMAAVLQWLGFDHPTLDAQVSEPVLGRGERVGEIRPVAGVLDGLRR